MALYHLHTKQALTVGLQWFSSQAKRQLEICSKEDVSTEASKGAKRDSIKRWNCSVVWW